MRRFLLTGVGLFVTSAAVGCSSGGGTTDAGCQPETDQAFCTRLGKNCEQFKSFDNCGASRAVDCGTCEGSCQQNVCQSTATTGGSSSGTTTGGTGSGGSVTGSAAGTTTGSATDGTTTGGATGGGSTTGAGSTTTGGSVSCTSTSCGDNPDILTANFTLNSWDVHNDSTLDGLFGESITLVVGFNAGTAAILSPGTYGYPSSPVEMSISGDDAGVFASKMLGTWVADGGITVTQLESGALYMEVKPAETQEWFSLQLNGVSGLADGVPLASTGFAAVQIGLRYFTNNSGTEQDSLLATTPTMSLYVDGG